MIKRTRVLVTGVGSGTGQAILTALQQNKHRYRIFVSDCDEYAAGLYLTKNRFVIPKLESEIGIESLMRVINKMDIDVVLPGNEFDVLELSKKKTEIERASKAKVIVSNLETISITNDKWLTYKYLEKSGVSIPRTVLVEDHINVPDVSNHITFPWIVKPRLGTASKGVNLVNSVDEALEVISRTPGALIQEFLQSSVKFEDKNLEYTCGVFSDADGKLHGPIVAERILKNGTSWIVRVVTDIEVSNYVLQVASKFNFVGPFNVQLIKTQKGPKILEVNCRFSGTTGIRSYFGFNEPKMAINNFVRGNQIRVKNLNQGLVLRYVENIVVK